MHPCPGCPARPRCRQVCRGPRCPDCTRSREAGRQQFIAEQRDPSHAWYSEAHWQRARARQLRLYPLCGGRAPEAFADGWRGQCHERRRTRRATVVDHIRAHKGDRELFYESRNRQSLCADCNRIKNIRYEGGFGRPPATSVPHG